MKFTFGYLGAMAYSENGNLFDDLFFSKSTPFAIIVTTFIFTGMQKLIYL